MRSDAVGHFCTSTADPQVRLLHVITFVVSAQAVSDAGRQYEGFLISKPTKGELCLHAKLLRYDNDS